MTVSEIKKMVQDDENLHEEYYKNYNFTLKEPNFFHEGINSISFNSAEKGTIFHLTMQLLDFSKFSFDSKDNVTEIKRQLDSFIENDIMSVEEADTVNINWISTFINSDIFREIYLANMKGKLYKEKAINYNLSFKELYGESEIFDEKIMMVGIVDLFFENENGEITLLDYKTDYVTEENLEQITEKYRIQLNLYKNAIERISKKKVSKKGLYFFKIGRFVEIK